MKIDNYTFGNNPNILSKKSIVAYGIPISVWFIVFVISIEESLLYAVPIALIGIYIVFYIRSYTLFIDDKGVWVLRGVFLWQKGIYGIRWDEFGEGVFYQDLTSWILKSYTIEIKHKFKEGHKIRLTQMKNGDIAITKINTVYMQKYQRKY